jgi:CubicO group peptidase (beta-lactamase class C family)
MYRHADARLTRRSALRLLAATSAGGALVTTLGAAPTAAQAASPTLAPTPARDLDPLLAPIDEQLPGMMATHQVPGVAVGVLLDGRPHAAGWGVTNLDYPRPVDAVTVFQIGSATKPFTGAALALLADQGRLDFDAPVRTYLPELELSDPEVTRRITVKHLVTHSSGFWGEEVPDGGRGDDALAKMVPQLAGRPQVAPLGRFFGYNNAAVALAGHVLATVSGRAYEDAIARLLLSPLGMRRSSFFLGDMVDYSVAAGHLASASGLRVERPFTSGFFTRSLAPTGGLLSTADDMLRWAQFQLGDGRAQDGTRVLGPATLGLTHSRLGSVGGLGTDDYDGIGVNWLLREVGGARIVEHGGTTPGQRARVLLVPERNFAFVLLTNAPGGSAMRNDLTAWVLEHYLGLRQPPRTPIGVPGGQLADYVGDYGVPGYWVPARLSRDGDTLTLQQLDDDGSPQGAPAPLAFYASDRAVVAGGPLEGTLVDFLRDDTGDLRWMRFLGRVFERLSRP